MDFGPRAGKASHTAAGERRVCPRCRSKALALQRRHVSPARLGEPLTTEYYECEACDAAWQYSPAQERWKPVST